MSNPTALNGRIVTRESEESVRARLKRPAIVGVKIGRRLPPEKTDGGYGVQRSTIIDPGEQHRED